MTTTKTKTKTKKDRGIPFSVLLLYPDYFSNDCGPETFYTFVWAGSSRAAVRKAQRAAVKHQESGTDLKAVDMNPLLVVAGHQFGLETGVD